jgi:hypothetical protein
VPRVLTMQRSIVPKPDRQKYLGRLPTRKAYYVRSKCRFWVFEDTELTGAFVEFMEADDLETLLVAKADAPEQHERPVPIYREVELS